MKAFTQARRTVKTNDDRLFSKVSIRKDLTKGEREFEKKLYEELKQKQEEAKASGDLQTRFIRRRGKIVKITVPVIQNEDSEAESEIED